MVQLLPSSRQSCGSSERPGHGPGPILIPGRRRLPEKRVEKPGCPTTPAPPFPVRSEARACAKARSAHVAGPRGLALLALSGQVPVDRGAADVEGLGDRGGALAAGPVALAVVVDRVVAVIRRHVLADQEPSAWTTVGRAVAAAARIGALLLLYCLRFVLAAPETARGLRRMVLEATPLPALPEAPAPGTIEPSCTKKAVLLALYRAHPDYGDRGTASRVPPSWPRRPDCSRAPPAATCTPNWTAGHHDCGPAR